MQKKCRCCDQYKEFSDFYKKLNSDKYLSLCKICHNEKSRKYREKNKESIRETKKYYIEKNKEIISKKQKEKRDSYSAEEKEKWKLYQKEYLKLNKKLLKEKKKIYYLNNRDKFLKSSKKNRINNLEKVKKYQDNYKIIKNKNRRYKRKNNIIFLLESNIRSIVWAALKRNGYTKRSKTQEILGCSFEEFKLYLESKFEPWMSWENKGLYNGTPNAGWDIDHIIPISSAKTEEDVIKLNHHTNLQPLDSYINRYIKRNNIEKI